MRNLLLFLIFLVPALSNAQMHEITEAQKNEALQTVTKFCDLFTQYCNGKRTIANEINALCSGADCSAFDDVATNKETTLRNYLMSIQQKYPTSMQIQMSKPTLADAKIYYEPILEQFVQWENVTGAGSVAIANYKVNAYQNIYVAFTVKANGKERKLIYDVKNKKVSAYIKGDGAFIQYCDGTIDVTNKNYKEAINKFTYAASNTRSSFRSKCYSLAAACSLMNCVLTGNSDYSQALEYAKKVEDLVLYYFISYLEYGISSSSYFLQDNLDKAFEYLDKAIECGLECEKRINESGTFKQQIGYLYGMLGISYAMKENHPKEAGNYFRKALQSGNFEAGWKIFQLWYSRVFGGLSVESIMDLSDDEVINALTKVAEMGHVDAMFWMGNIEEIDDNTKEAFEWYIKSSNQGNIVAVACLGRLLTIYGDNDAQKQTGINLLKESLVGNKLELQLDEYNKSMGLPPFPRSRQDVIDCLKKLGVKNFSVNNSSSSKPTSQNSTSSVNGASNTNSTSSNSKRSGIYAEFHSTSLKESAKSVCFRKNVTIYGGKNKKVKIVTSLINNNTICGKATREVIAAGEKCNWNEMIDWIAFADIKLPSGTNTCKVYSEAFVDGKSIGTSLSQNCVIVVSNNRIVNFRVL